MHNFSGRLAISNYSYYARNKSSFLDFHLRPLGREVKSYIKDTNDFSKNLYSLPDNIILCTVDVVGLYAKILYDQGLSALRKQLDTRQKKMSLPQRL